MTFEVRWTESSFKKLQKIDRLAQKRIVEKLDEAAADPFVVAKKLSGVSLYQSWQLCVIVSVEKQKMVILVIDVGHRSKIYRNL